jgi:DNA-binding transcriptional LysR family regulator
MHDLEQGSLETVLDRNAAKIPGLYLYYPSRSTALPKLRAFIDFAAKQMRPAFVPDDYLPR